VRKKGEEKDWNSVGLNKEQNVEQRISKGGGIDENKIGQLIYVLSEEGRMEG
jgi:hypothetical protein